MLKSVSYKVYLPKFVCIYPTPPPRAECDTCSFFCRVLLVWIQSFPSKLFTLPRLKNPVCPTFYLFSWRRADGFMLFLKAFAQNEIQTASPWVVEIIFLNDGGLCWRDFFHLHWRKWISDMTGINTAFDIEVGNRKLGFFRRLWREQTAQKVLRTWPLRTMWCKEIFPFRDHLGVRWTLYFVRQIAPGVSKAAVKTVVRECEECQLINPAPMHWSKWALNVQQTWNRVAMDITHCNRAHFLMVIDCGPARFAIWQHLPWQDATSVINRLKVLFYEWGLPTEILTDNDTAFQSSLLKTFLDEWRVRLRFCCAYVPSDIGIVVRCHRTVKRITTRKRYTIPEAVYWYNIMPKDDVPSATAPANMVYWYHIRLKGINGTSVPTHNQQQAVFRLGDRVWVKTPHGRCTIKYKVGRVTGITSAQNITVDGIPCHVKDLQPIAGPGQLTVCSNMVSENASKRFVTIRERPCEQTPSTNAGEASSNNTSNEDLVTILPRRSTQCKRPPPEYFMCDHRIRGECSSNATNNLTSEKQKESSHCYRHTEIRRRKGRKRCDFFYGGEWDKPTWNSEIW